MTVELGYGPEFDLRKGDADILLQLRGDDVMWQKERLLNLALAALPPACRNVAWIDCDVLFTEPDWAERTSAALDRHVLVQPFGVTRLPAQDWRPGEPYADAESVVSLRRAIERA